MYIFFDTETTGLPKSWSAPISDVNNWPRVIQLAYVVTDTEFNVLDKFCELVKPDGWTVPEQKFWIDHGYSTAKNMAEGVPMPDILEKFADALRKCTHVFAHNMDFDYPVVGAEMIRYGCKPGVNLTKVCTMKDFGIRNNGRWPKLEWLHEHLLGHGFEGAHDALNDVMATINVARAFNYAPKHKVVI